MKKLLVALSLIVCMAGLSGCPGHGNLKKGKIPPGKYKKYK